MYLKIKKQRGVLVVSRWFVALLLLKTSRTDMRVTSVCSENFSNFSAANFIAIRNQYNKNLFPAKIKFHVTKLKMAFGTINMKRRFFVNIKLNISAIETIQYMCIEEVH
jgi:hypothetical protein